LKDLSKITHISNKELDKKCANTIKKRRGWEFHNPEKVFYVIRTVE